jgi:hypothetical protein
MGLSLSFEFCLGIGAGYSFLGVILTGVGMLFNHGLLAFAIA